MLILLYYLKPITGLVAVDQEVVQYMDPHPHQMLLSYKGHKMKHCLNVREWANVACGKKALWVVSWSRKELYQHNSIYHLAWYAQLD